MRLVPLSVIVVGSDKEEELMLIGKDTRMLVNVNGNCIFFCLLTLSSYLPLSSFFAAVAIYLRWQLKHQWRRVTMEAARGGWDGARESLESSSSFASFLLLGRWDARWDGRRYGMEFNLSSSSFRFVARVVIRLRLRLLSSEKRI